ncbi:MAG: TauD/TfdA family dioxygenase [Proteobacteria bacterium]|nr:TauD/TfdA family dioxygenase [Pseudomonadota bacterium]
MSVSVTPLDAPLGAEITGVDLSAPLDEAVFAVIRQALLDHLVIVISGQEAELEPLARFGRRFGGLVPHVLEQYHHPETSDVSIISTDPKTGAGRTTENPAGAFWHSDLSYDANPSDATLLFSVEVPADGGDTLFSNLAAAYETLPEATKTRIEGLSAIHRYGYHGGGAVVELSQDQETRHPDVSHPIVRTHRETGRKALFVNPGFTVRIEGMEEDESRALLDELFDHATKPGFLYRHHWQPGQIVACDNRATMHSATGGYEGQPRTLWRMIVGGTG